MGALSRAFLYVVAATDSLDEVTCRVPWRVDERVIFFGPCKKRLRQKLRQEFLRPGEEDVTPCYDLYLVGLSPSTPRGIRKVRKVLWAGRVRRVMTFARAYEELRGREYEKMRDDPQSPLHVRPLYEGGRLVGYERRSDLHVKDDAWVLDLVSSRNVVRREAERVYLHDHISAEDGFRRDACAECENLFFAHREAATKGIDVDDEAVAILRDAQPKRRTEIDCYAVFGRRARKSADGLRGGYLELNGDLAERLIGWVRRRSG